jgi:hypothetical protein
VVEIDRQVNQDDSSRADGSALPRPQAAKLQRRLSDDSNIWTSRYIAVFCWGSYDACYGLVHCAFEAAAGKPDIATRDMGMLGTILAEIGCRVRISIPLDDAGVYTARRRKLAPGKGEIGEPHP